MEAPPSGNIDPVLAPFLTADDPRAGEMLLAQLLEDQAAPVIARVLRAKTGRSDGERDEEIADLTSAAREELISRLLALRSGEDPKQIRNFGGYVAAVTYNVWAQHLRTEKPGRAMLLNRVRYLLENRTTQRGFAIWDGPKGERLCGLQSTRAASRPVGLTPKLQLLASDPFAVAREAFAGRDWRRMDLAELLAQLFRWIDSPVELRHLIDALVEFLGVSDEKVPIELHSAATAGAEFVDPGVSAVDSLKWTEYLRWLWTELARLSLPQRTAFLLHSDVIRDFDLRGIASLREIGAALGFPAEQFATIWGELPHDDATIAERLQLQRQQVINLRRVARERLGAAWRAWIK
jgi:DNA-directed RNA polymerase specialized sigma24 family protein